MLTSVKASSPLSHKVIAACNNKVGEKVGRKSKIVTNIFRQPLEIYENLFHQITIIMSLYKQVM